jgi:hypothetical protein
MADSYESVMNFGISAYYSPNVVEKAFSEVRGGMDEDSWGIHQRFITRR